MPPEKKKKYGLFPFCDFRLRVKVDEYGWVRLIPSAESGRVNNKNL